MIGMKSFFYDLDALNLILFIVIYPILSYLFCNSTKIFNPKT